MKNEYTKLIEEYDKLLSLLHRNAFLSDDAKDRKWQERIDDALDGRVRLAKLQMNGAIRHILPDDLLNQLSDVEENTFKLKSILTELNTPPCNYVSTADENEIRQIIDALEDVQFFQ